MRWLLVCLLAAGCGMGMDQGSGDVAPSDAGSPTASPPTASQAAWLDPQNAVRASAKPAPTPALTPFTWSDDAAQVAQAWANNCVYAHNQGRGNRGENIAANTPSGSWTPANVVAAWAGEASDYDYASNTCASGKECGHYTQIVWRDTQRAGCAMATCTKNSPFGNGQAWDFWVATTSRRGTSSGSARTEAARTRRGLTVRAAHC